ncbi:hypothetical protein [Bradyrhizobium sp.]
MGRKVDELDETKRLMDALVRMKPKPHEEMKVSKKKSAKTSLKKRASSKYILPPASGAR